ncbi:MAG: hypothetical protein HZA93_24220 [Verrucomicrobia bacterium]|nr:hypothetical protein [Verrucomicrobiota bacterium]
MSTRARSIRVEDILPKGWAELFDRNSPRVGIGYDIATTTKGKSNPSAITVTQQGGNTYYARLLLRFKAGDPEIPWLLLNLIVEGLRSRDLRARKLCIDATNERYFAVQTRAKFAGKLPVELVVASENTDYRGETMSMKDYLANLLINTMDDGYYALPPERWVERDYRQTVRDRGSFFSDVLDDGGHADCHRSGELALHALIAAGGPATAAAVATGRYGAPARGPARKLNNKFAHKFGRRGGSRRAI